MLAHHCRYRRETISVMPVACVRHCLHAGVSHFALWLDSPSRFRALKLFDEVLVKQSIATLLV